MSNRNCPHGGTHGGSRIVGTKLKQPLKLKHLKLVRDRVQVLHVLVLLRAVDDLIRSLLVDALLHDLLPVLLLRVRHFFNHRRVLGHELVQESAEFFGRVRLGREALGLRRVAACVEIKILRRVRAESTRRPPRHRRDACSMAWRCRFVTTRRRTRHTG